MTGKPLVFRLAGWAQERLGAGPFTDLLEKGLAATLGAQRAAIESNLRRVLRHGGKEPSPDELEQLVGRAVRLAAEHQSCLFSFSRQAAKAWAQTTEGKAVSAVEALRKRGKGVILAGPHFGNMALALGVLSARLPLHVAFINAAPYQWLRAEGLQTETLAGAAAAFTRALAANEVVLLYADIDFFPDGRTAPFFGAPFRPPHGPARLALASGAPLLPFYPVTERGRTRLLADEPLDPETLDQNGLEEGLLRSMERFISAHPEHWQVGRDLWNLEAVDRENRARLRRVSLFRGLGLPGY